jgi:hypothetical protein
MKKIHVHDDVQPDYSYELIAKEGADFDPDFDPDLSPQQMLELGIFDGDYFHGHIEEYPQSWFAHAKISDHGKDPSLNLFGVHASQPLRVWQVKGWIHPDDPRGWFQWYCRYYLGRRHPDDARQIKRWKAMTRHIAQIKKNCIVGDLSCRKVQRQALLHWAYDSRKY